MLLDTYDPLPPHLPTRFICVREPHPVVTCPLGSAPNRVS